MDPISRLTAPSRMTTRKESCHSGEVADLDKIHAETLTYALINAKKTDPGTETGVTKSTRCFHKRSKRHCSKQQIANDHWTIS